MQNLDKMMQNNQKYDKFIDFLSIYDKLNDAKE